VLAGAVALLVLAEFVGLLTPFGFAVRHISHCPAVVEFRNVHAGQLQPAGGPPLSLSVIFGCNLYGQNLTCECFFFPELTNPLGFFIEMQAAPNNKPKKKRKEEQTAEELHLFCKSELGSKCTPSDVLFVPQSSRIAVLCREENSGSIRVLKFDVDESNTGTLLARVSGCS